MSPELARNLIYAIGWLLLATIAILPPLLYWKYGVGKPKYLQRIGEYLALRGLTLTAGKRCQRVHMPLDGALYAIRYCDAAGQEYEAVAAVTPIAGVFIGEGWLAVKHQWADIWGVSPPRRHSRSDSWKTSIKYT